MGDPRGFLTVERKKTKDRPVAERVRDFHELTPQPESEALRAQASRCMDCGIPFCHQGCPLGNLIPEFNDLVYRGRVEQAAHVLLETNNFPEFTGRVCPAPCEAACTLNIREEPVTIKDVERFLADELYAAGLTPHPAPSRSGRRVAVIGSGPAGLAAAQELARMGHDVTVFERDQHPGGLLRYGIPDFKLEKHVIDRRLAQLEAEGVVFRTGCAVGEHVTGASLVADFDAVVLCIGARVPRDLDVPGRDFDGVHYAMDFLSQQNRRVSGLADDPAPAGGTAGSIWAAGKHVVVLGGGDTGADCVGTSARQGAKSITQLELMPRPPLVRPADNPWPRWPLVLRTSTSHEEGCTRDWALLTKRLLPAEDGRRVGALEAVRVELRDGKLVERPEDTLTLPCDLLLLAMGFLGPEPKGPVTSLGLALDRRGNVVTDAEGRTSRPGVFAAGDASRGQSLVVWAIADGRRVARGVHRYLGEREAATAPKPAPTLVAIR